MVPTGNKAKRLSSVNDTTKTIHHHHHHCKFIISPSTKAYLGPVKTSIRSSQRRCSIKKGVLENFAEFTGKHLCQSLFSLKKRLWHRGFPVNFAKFLRTPFLQNTSGRLLLIYDGFFLQKISS